MACEHRARAIAKAASSFSPALASWKMACKSACQASASTLPQHRHLVCPRRRGHRARTQRGESGGLRHPRADASGKDSGFALRAAPNYEISCQDYADPAAFAREVGPLTLQTIAPGDDLSEHPGRRPAGSPPAAEPTVARNLLQLIGAAFGKRVLLVQPCANTTCSAATKPDRANTILINTRNGEPLLALFGHEFGHNLRAQRPDLYRPFSRLALATNPVPFNYRPRYATECDSWSCQPTVL